MNENSDTYASKGGRAANYCELSNKVRQNLRKVLPNDFWSNIGPTKIKYYPISSFLLINSELQIHSLQLQKNLV